MAIEKEIIIDVNVKGEEEIQDLGQSIEGVSGSVDDVNSSLDQMPGATGEAVKGVRSLAASFKALLANPIVLLIAAIVGSLVALFKAFQRTAAGGDKIAKVFEGIGAAIGPVLDSLGKLASGLVAFFSGDVTGGIEQISTAFNGLGKEIETAYLNAQRLVDLRRELQTSTRNLSIFEAQLTRNMEEQRAILDDIDKPIQKRIEANEKLNELNLKLLESRQQLIDKQVEEATLQFAQAGRDDEAQQAALDRLAELTVASENAQAERFRIEKEYVVKRNELNNTARMEAEQARIDQAFAERETLNDLNTQRLDNIQLQGDAEIEAIRGIETKKTEVEKESLLERLENEKAIQQMKVQAVKNGFSVINDLAFLFANESEKSQKKAFEVQKAASIASTTVNTIEAAIAAFKSFQGLGPVGVGLGIAAAAAATAKGLAAVKQISQTEFGGGFQNSPTAGFNPNAPAVNGQGNFGAPNFNVVGTSGINQISEVLNNQPPVEAYVVASNVTTQQALDRNKVDTASM